MRERVEGELGGATYCSSARRSCPRSRRHGHRRSAEGHTPRCDTGKGRRCSVVLEKHHRPSSSPPPQSFESWSELCTVRVHRTLTAISLVGSIPTIQRLVTALTLVVTGAVSTPQR